MREEFLHYVWQHQYFDAKDLKTASGVPLQILHQGYHNHHSGPDFSMGRIMIDGIEWHGNVEIHYLASDWKRHHHHTDAAYDNVILHVVWKNDIPVLDLHQQAIPTLELKDRIDPNLISKFNNLIKSHHIIPCENSFSKIDSLTKMTMLDRVMAQRMEHKAAEVKQLLENNKYDWEETTYQLLAKNFGFKVNSAAMLTLSEKLPLKILMKQSADLTGLEALFLGQAGLLDHYFTEEYPICLKKEYDYLAKKYNLLASKMSGNEWKFSKMRPPNFPTIRLAELASVLAHNQHLFAKLIEAETYDVVAKIFYQGVSAYWQTHYVFEKSSINRSKSIGKTSIENIILNTVVPLLVCYAKEKGQEHLIERALGFLENINAEENNITKYWQSLGQPVLNAFDSQSLIGLYNNYCKPKACLNCSIGNSLLHKI